MRQHGLWRVDRVLLRRNDVLRDPLRQRPLLPGTKRLWLYLLRIRTDLQQRALCDIIGMPRWHGYRDSPGRLSHLLPVVSVQ